MNTFRRFLVGLANFVCVLAVSTLIWLVTLHFTILNSEAVKGWLSESGIYNNVVPTMLQLQQAQGEVPDTDFLTPAITQNLLQTTFTPAYVQQQVEHVIDRTYAWVDGKALTIDFTVGLNQKQDDVVTQLTRALEPYVARLPECPSASGFSELSCRPPGASDSEFARQVAAKATSESDFLNKPLTSQDLAQQNQANNNQPSPVLSQLPNYRQLVNILLVVLPILLVTSLVTIFFAAEQRLVAFLRLTRRLFWGTIITLAAGALVWYLGNPSVLSQLPVDQSPVFKLLLPAIQKAMQAIGQMVTILSAVVVVVSGGSWIGLRIIRRRQNIVPLADTPSTPVPPHAAS